MTDHNTGLTSEQAAQLEKLGKVNRDRKSKSNSYFSIIRRNVFTFFNFINVFLAALILSTGITFESIRNVLFLGVAICNTAIGLFQEIRAKRATDRLKVIVENTATVVRDSAEWVIPVNKVVLGDILVLTAGCQVPADCEVVLGGCVVDQSILTGEADSVPMQSGDKLLSGSFVLSGTCRARTVAVGADSYGHRLANQARRIRHKKSDIVHTINIILAVMSVVIIPMGVSLFLSQYDGNADFVDAVFSTSAAVIGMLPEGMMLLTSTVFALASIMLARRKVLSQDLYSAEALARTDVLCLDKTGTLTQGKLEVAQVIPLSDNFSEGLIGDLAAATQDRNPTAAAVKEHFAGMGTGRKCVHFEPFDSARKWSGADFDSGRSLIMGAAEFVIPNMDEQLQSLINEHSATARVVMLAECDSVTAPTDTQPLALILLRDRIRPQAAQTMRYFAEQGVSVRVISGDHHSTAGDVARRVGIDGWDKQVDMSTVADEDIDAVVAENVVFGRVTPEQKRLIIATLKKAGHTVTMTGDGVNDVLALKEADCSVSPATATDMARDTSKLILLASDFDSLPEVVRQGRRSINNLKRSVSLFLIKIVYSLVLSVSFLFLSQPYPFEPIHLTLITFAGVAVPGFLLSFEPNCDRVKGRFIADIITRSLPGGTAIASGVILAALISAPLGLPHSQYVTVCVVASGIAALINLMRVCMPFSVFRSAVFAAMCTLFACGVLIFGWVFSLTALSPLAFLALALCVGCDLGVYALVLWISSLAVKRRFNQ